MAMAWLWTGMVAVSLIFGALTGNLNALSAAALEGAQSAVELCLAMCGVMCLWTGVMEVMNQCHLTDRLASLFRPLLKRLLPNASRDSETLAAISANLSADLLGLGNAATPLGLKAMEKLQELNPRKDTATNAMIMFLVLNTSGLVIVPVGIMVYRAQLGAAQPTDVFIPILIATFIATLAGIIATSIYQRINLFNRTLMLTLGGACACVAAIIFGFAQLDRATMDIVGTSVANIMLFSIIVLFIAVGVRKKVNVYDAFIEGAKGGFETAVRIIPYLVAILVGIGVFRAAGVMDWITGGLSLGGRSARRAYRLGRGIAHGSHETP